jgi:threonine synthase
MKNKILYYSTNRNLKTDSISGFKKKVAFEEALFMGMAPDKGLFMPSKLPKLSKKEILALKGKSYAQAAYRILRKFLHYDISDNELKKIINDAYKFSIPIDKLNDTAFIARLDQGPTASFKDFAAQLMARLMQKLKPENKKITILVATSGDTGSAIGEAYRSLKGIRVYILYPKNEVSSIQKKHMDTIGKNVQAIAVDGKFDDCQRLVKEAFSDNNFKKLNLTSANSINIGRILPQIVYYFYIYANVADKFQSVVFSIPSGNFGNSLGCELARRMGLPVKKIIIATNENDEFPKFLRTSVYKKIEPSKVCLSNAMNVGNPSNLARYFELYDGTIDKEGFIHKKPNLKEMRKYLYSAAISDEETVKTIKDIYKKYKLIIEPHGAVGIAALEKYNKKILSICIETANAAKFPEIIKKELKINPKMPNSMKVMYKRKGKPHNLSKHYADLKKYLLSDFYGMD